MAGRLLLLVLLLAGTLRAARCCPGPPDPGTDPDLDLGPGPDPVSPGPRRAVGAGGWGGKRGCGRGGGPGFSGWARLSPRSWDPPAAPFWTMATPQRFGRRR
uniref:Uncharacterized protein n=1 Tax=Aquila chrysaetos chrysaetos TaxID=223781 RepID=A0A663EQZ7_AQUCH